MALLLRRRALSNSDPAIRQCGFCNGNAPSRVSRMAIIPLNMGLPIQRPAGYSLYMHYFRDQSKADSIDNRRHITTNGDRLSNIRNAVPGTPGQLDERI